LHQIDPDDPFLEPAEDESLEPAPAADRLRLLALATEDSARITATELLARRTPLSVVDRADLKVLLTDADPSWLPDVIPVRETRAVVLAHLLPTHPALIDELIRRIAAEQAALDARANMMTDQRRQWEQRSASESSWKFQIPQE